MSRRLLKSGIAALAVAAATTAAYGQWFGGKDAKSIPIQDAADMLHAVTEADRTVYTQRVVNRLMLQEKVITADEHFMDKKALPLPAQMFRFGAEKAAEKTQKFSYSLLSLWPVNKQNAPRTAVDALDLHAPECGFWWYKVSKLEHQLINLRHTQHHGAQLADRLRAAAGGHVKWVGASPTRAR